MLIFNLRHAVDIKHLMLLNGGSGIFKQPLLPFLQTDRITAAGK